jgi:hypothetical protein
MFCRHSNFERSLLRYSFVLLSSAPAIVKRCNSRTRRASTRTRAQRRPPKQC